MLEKSKRDSINYINKIEFTDARVVDATIEHAGYLQHHLRPTDIRECMIVGASPWIALHEPLRDPNGQTWTIIINNQPCAMFGVSDICFDEEYRSAAIWLLGSNLCEEEPLKFCRVTKRIIDMLLIDYDILENLVPIDHTKTIKWLNWLGFEFAKKPTTINGFQCVRFVRCNLSKNVAWN
tara:strand:+ start:261 stop:800 length:540 start_codon:yes stop_codon:yes gene_type:complete